MNQPSSSPQTASHAQPQRPPTDPAAHTSPVSGTEADGLALVIPPHVWLRIGVLGGLFALVHSDFLVRTARIAWTDGDWSHAMIVPLFSLYFVYQQRDRLADAIYRTCWPGLAVLSIGLAGYIAGLATANDMLKGYSMIVNLFGLVLLLTGPAAMKVLWFPIFYLVFAVKISPDLWQTIAWQMQLFAAHASVFTLNIIGIDAHVTTTTIELWRGTERLGALDVAEACSGMRMLMTFIALGVAVAYLWERPWWARLAMVLSTLPIAILVNVGRVTILGVLYLINPSYSSGDFHLMIGMFMLLPALGLFLLIGYLLELLTEDVPDDDSPRIVRRKDRPAKEPSP